jgi:hypothetical protein
MSGTHSNLKVSSNDRNNSENRFKNKSSSPGKYADEIIDGRVKVPQTSKKDYAYSH